MGTVRSAPLRIIAMLAAAGALAAPAVAQQRTETPPPRAPAARDSAAALRELERRLGRGITQQEIVERLRRSGLSRAQVRARLQQMGYDPGLADPYFDALERGIEPPSGQTDEQFVDALRRIGVVESLPLAGAADGSPAADAPEARAAGGIEIFGRSLFRRPSTEFEPILTGPAPPNYRIGPGDEISLVLTGDVELPTSCPSTARATW